MEFLILSAILCILILRTPLRRLWAESFTAAATLLAQGITTARRTLEYRTDHIEKEESCIKKCMGAAVLTRETERIVMLS
jgi:hypothetical protein